jgi:dihydrofolate synthase/folylpolyglutamate synthase
VITSLSYDHMAVLGNTLTLIAGEKAGIIKPGIPVVSAPQVDEARVVLEKISAERRSALTMVGRDVQVETGEHSLDGQNLTVFTPQPVRFHLPLLGAHQAVNAATAYTALRASGLKISEEAIRKGFAEVSWPCRFEVIQREPPVILDSAHNPDSFEKLAGTLEDYFPGKAITLIFGSSEDKDMAGMLNVLKGKVSLVLATQAVHPRATEPEKIIELANRLGVRAETAMPVGAALNRALELAVGRDTIIVSAGSMFVTAEVKTAWQKLNNRS